MAYTATDLEKLERAAIELATGVRKASIVFTDGTRVDFTPATLPQLRELLADVRYSLSMQSQTGAGRGYFLVSSSKGF